jgi:hypothetical protein
VFLTKAAFDVFEALFDEQETDMDEDKFFGLLGVRDYIRKKWSSFFSFLYNRLLLN